MELKSGRRLFQNLSVFITRYRSAYPGDQGGGRRGAGGRGKEGCRREGKGGVKEGGERRGEGGRGKEG